MGNIKYDDDLSGDLLKGASMAVIVYRYGTRHWDFPEILVEQLRLAHRLRNKLVETEHDHDAAMAAMWSEHPAVAQTEIAVADAEAVLTSAIADAKAEHQQQRTRVSRPKTAAAVTAARKVLRDARRERRAAISGAYEASKSRIEEIRGRRREAQKATYVEFGQRGYGLYWGTDQHIRDHHKTAVARIKSLRTAGRSAQLRFKRFDGSGTLRIQLQRMTGDPVRAPSTLASGEGKWRNTVRLPAIAAADPDEHASLTRAERRHRGRTTITLALTYGDNRHIDIPIQVHRPLPPTADICMIELTRRRITSRYETAVTIVCKVPDPEPPQDRPTMAVHFGWRHLPDGSVRVGTWAASQPVTDIPADLDEVVHAWGKWGEIVVPASLINIATRPASIRSRRDSSLTPVLNKTASWLEKHPHLWDGDDAPCPRPEHMRMWRSPGRLVAAARTWASTPAISETEDAHETLACIETWRKQDKHLWEWESNERQQIIRQRRDIYQRVAAWIARTAGLVLIDNIAIADLRRREDPEETDPALPGEATDRARARAATVAPGALRQAITVTASREGIPVTQVPVAGMSRRCTCGHTNPTDARFAASVDVICDGCGTAYDQDHTVARQMITASGPMTE